MADERRQEPHERLYDRERLRDPADRTTQHASTLQESRRLRDENQLMRERIEAWTVTWQETKQTVDALVDYVRANNDARDELQRCQHELAATKAMLLRERALRMLLELQGGAGCLPPPAAVEQPAPPSSPPPPSSPEHAAQGSSTSAWLRTMPGAPATLLLRTE